MFGQLAFASCLARPCARYVVGKGGVQSFTRGWKCFIPTANGSLYNTATMPNKYVCVRAGLDTCTIVVLWLSCLMARTPINLRPPVTSSILPDLTTTGCHCADNSGIPLRLSFTRNSPVVRTDNLNPLASISATSHKQYHWQGVEFLQLT